VVCLKVGVEDLAGIGVGVFVGFGVNDGARVGVVWLIGVICLNVGVGILDGFGVGVGVVEVHF